MIRDYSDQQQLTKRNHELYGPIWIGASLIIEFCIISHLIGTFKLQSRLNEETAYNREDLEGKFAT